jgi:hypothetical protein
VTDPEAPFEPQPSYVEMHAYACAMRLDWDRRDLQDAMTAVIHAGWPYKDIHREVMRLAWTGGETPSTLRNSARRPAPAAKDPEAYAHGGLLWRAALEEVAARKTGPLQRLTEENDPARSASP